MAATFVVYIDESGDEGFSFGKGSTDWFILSAVITQKTSDLETVKLVDRIRQLLGKPEKNPLHFCKLRHGQRLPLIGEITKADLRTVTVFFFKPLLKEPQKFQGRHRFYFYATRFLLERVSWYCRDHRASNDVGDGTAEIVFSNRAGMSYFEMSDYLSYLKKRTSCLDVRIYWPTINPEKIKAYSPTQRMGLQIADAVASGFGKAVEPQYGYIEDRYARLLKPTVYQRGGVYRGYGLKFWPKEADAILRKDPRMEWLTEYENPGTQEPTR
jgi:hypothetical protein